MRLISGAVVAMALALGAASLSGQSAPAAPLQFVSTPWPPFTNAAGQPRFALESRRGRARPHRAHRDDDHRRAAQFTPALLSDGYDGSAAAWRDADREQFLLFSQPYLENRLVLVGRRGENVAATSLADLKGRRIALVGGYAYGDASARRDMIPVRASSEEDGLSLVLASKADYVLMDELVVQYILENHPNEAKTS